MATTEDVEAFVEDLERRLRQFEHSVVQNLHQARGAREVHQLNGSIQRAEDDVRAFARWLREEAGNLE